LCIAALQKMMNAVFAFRCIDPRAIASNPASAGKTFALPDVGAPLCSDERQPIEPPGDHRQTAI
jgi:hypothetical protein